MKATTRILPLAGLLVTGLFVSAAGNVQAQSTAQITTKQFSACYVPATGTVYLIKQPGLRSECASGHVQFSWSAGGDATAVTPAVVITDADGWAATGTFGTGAIPVTGPGVRLMWYPHKAALRGGGVPTTQWDDANIGNYSVALGSGTTASAEAATALGRNTRASGQRAIATGAGTVASGFSSLTDAEYGPGGNLYALQFGDQSTDPNGPPWVLGSGKILKRTLRSRPDGFIKWVIAHELAHAHLRNAGRWPGEDPERAADAVAAEWGFARPG